MRPGMDNQEKAHRVTKDCGPFKMELVPER